MDALKKRSKRVLQVWSSTWLKRQLKITLVLCNNKLQTFPFIHKTHPFCRNHKEIRLLYSCCKKKKNKKSTDHCPGMFGPFGSPGFWTMAAPSSIHFDFQSSRVMQGPATWQLQGLRLQDSQQGTWLMAILRLWPFLRLRDTKSRGCWWPPSKYGMKRSRLESPATRWFSSQFC